MTDEQQGPRLTAEQLGRIRRMVEDEHLLPPHLGALLLAELDALREKLDRERQACADVARYHARRSRREAERLTDAGYPDLARHHNSSAVAAEVIAEAIVEGGAFVDEALGR
jgi:hypothetical protein